MSIKKKISNWNKFQGETSTDFSYLKSLLYEKNIDYFNNIFELVSNKPNVKLVFSSTQEGNNMNKFVLKLIFRNTQILNIINSF